MQSTRRVCLPLFLVAIFASTLFVAGCSVHARVYDPYYHDYHQWDGESGYYVQWEHDTHRDHRDFDRRSDDDKKAYWDWRHHHEDNH